VKSEILQKISDAQSMNSNVADALIRFQSTGGTAQERLNALKPYQTLKTKRRRPESCGNCRSLWLES
jgi:hypothetical protein